MKKAKMEIAKSYFIFHVSLFKRIENVLHLYISLLIHEIPLTANSNLFFTFHILKELRMSYTFTPL